MLSKRGTWGPFRLKIFDKRLKFDGKFVCSHSNSYILMRWSLHNSAHVGCGKVGTDRMGNNRTMVMRISRRIWIVIEIYDKWNGPWHNIQNKYILIQTMIIQHVYSYTDRATRLFRHWSYNTFIQTLNMQSLNRSVKYIAISKRMSQNFICVMIILKKKSCKQLIYDHTNLCMAVFINHLDENKASSGHFIQRLWRTRAPPQYKDRLSWVWGFSC